MVQRNNILNFSSPARSLSPGNKALGAIADCRGVVERALPKLMAGLFDKLDDALYELADKSESNQLQSAYFDAMRTVRRRREKIHAGFVDGVLSDYDRLWIEGPRDLSPEQRESGQEDSGLSLLNDEELEQSLAVTNLISKGENRYNRELFALNRRFGMLLGQSELDDKANPVGPAAICNRFHLTIRDLPVDTTVLLVVYKLFDKQVMNFAGGLYEELTSLLTHAGFVPKASTPSRPRSQGAAAKPWRGSPPPAPDRASRDHSPTKDQEFEGYSGTQASPGVGQGPSGFDPLPAGQPAASAHYPSPGYAQAGPGHGSGAVYPGAQPGLFHTLQNLLAGYRDSAGYPSNPAPAGVPVVATPELIGVLSELQRANPAPAGNAPREDDKPDLRGRLKEVLELERDGKLRRSLGKTDDDTIDVIAMLFEFLLGDPNLPDAMKALIARLQIPMLKVALMDKDFFSSKLHPARRLLNELARGALGWSDDGDRSDNSLYGRIESVIERVINGFEDDPSLFDELTDEFAEFMEREQRGAEIAEERTNQVIRGKEQLRVAKERVSREIADRLAAYPRVPLVARTVLEDAWKDVLLLAYLRQGSESGAWKDGLDIADRLLRSVEPRAGYTERQELLRTIPDLLRSLREGLAGISYDQHKMARLFKELQSCHIACLRGVQGAQPAEGVPEGSYSIPQPASPAARDDGPTQHSADDEESAVRAAAAEDGGTIQHDEYSDQAENLAVGGWLELQQDDAQPVRIKLSWKSDISDAYVFVNRKGAKVLELTLAGVAKLLRNGSAKVLDEVDTPIMDKAMVAMIASLKGGIAH
jgi:hypothetical protein